MEIGHFPCMALPLRAEVASEPRVECGSECALDEHRLNPDLDVHIPGNVPFADYLARQNAIARYTNPNLALYAQDSPPGWREMCPDRNAHPCAGHKADVAGPDRGGWPRLGDVPASRTTIDRQIRRIYLVEDLLPAGTRLDRIG